LTGVKLIIDFILSFITVEMLSFLYVIVVFVRMTHAMKLNAVNLPSSLTACPPDVTTNVYRIHSTAALSTLLVVLSVPPIHSISLIVNSGTELARFPVTDDDDFLFDPDSCFMII
jgi:hypothetical protein